MRGATGYCGRGLDTLLFLTFSAIYSLLFIDVGGTCPSDVKSQADSCFTAFSSQLQNMQNSRRKLCCGVDVETLRAFCSSYVTGMECIKSLRKQCPKDVHSQINKSLINLKGSEDGLRDLCSDDSLYEKYAQYQGCFARQGHVSEQCFGRFINNTIRLMSTVDGKSMDELCSDLKKVLNCIKPNIEVNCGSAAASLVGILINPMVKKSTQCDYRVVQETTNKPQYKKPGQTGTTAEKTHKYITDNGSGATSQRLGFEAAVVFLVILLILWY